MIQCPECTSQQVWKDGIRKIRHGDVQRYLCRHCGYRFSQPPLKEKSRQKISSSSSIDSTRQIGATPKAHGLVKNLAKVEPLKEGPAGATKPSEAKIKGKIVEAMWQLKKDGYSSSTIYSYSKYLRLLMKYGANLDDPESVKEVIATQESWGSASKLMAVAAYTFFASINGMHWNPPKYKPKRRLPFIPLESEIDALIASAGKKLATTLQMVKETGMRIGEACALRWVDVDLKHNTITVNDPEKGNNPRMLKISDKLAAMLNRLPKNSERIFGKQKPRNVANHLRWLRKRIAIKLQNPRLNQIHFHTLRHWKATMEYHKTRNLLHVMEMLGHRAVQSTLMYTHLIKFEGEEYHSAVAETIDEAKSLIEAGFEYVCTHKDTMLFRKRK